MICVLLSEISSEHTDCVGADRVNSASYVEVFVAVLEYWRTCEATRYSRVFRLGLLAKQFTFVVNVTKVDDETETPWSVSFNTDRETLMYTEDGQSIPHTIPVTPAPEYHCRHC